MRNVAILGGTFAVLTAASWWTWTHPPGAAPTDKVPMFHASAGEVGKITWTGETSTVVVEKKHDAGGDYAWVTLSETPKDPPADGSSVEPTVTTFKGSTAADELWDKFSPMLALREIDVNSMPDKTVLGLDDAKSTLELVKGSDIYTVKIGGETFGAKDRYAGLADKVYLVDADDLKPLQQGKAKLMDRTTQPYSATEVEKVVVTRNGQSVTFVHRNKDDAKAQFWARETSPDDKDIAADTWIDKALKVGAQSYVAAADLPTGLTAVYTMTVTGKDGEFTVDVKVDASGDYYANSTWDRSDVKLTKSQAGEAADDVDGMLAGTLEPEPAPAPAPPGGPPGMPPGRPMPPGIVPH